MKLIKSYDIEFGIVISASHNAYIDNGIKLFDSKSAKPNKEDEDKIINNFLTIAKNVEIKEDDTVIEWPEASQAYENLILENFSKDFLKNKKIVLDCANGAAYKIAPKIFRDAGAEIIELATAKILPVDR